MATVIVKRNKTKNAGRRKRNRRNRRKVIVEERFTFKKPMPKRTPRGDGNMQAVGIAQGSVFRSSKPKVQRTADGCRIRHKELIANIVGTQSFDVAQFFSINPGISKTFPWLSNQAKGWEQYEFNRLAFHYVTRCPTTNAGSMWLVPDYDAADQAPTSESQASSYQDVVEAAPWKNFSCFLNPNSMRAGMKKHFVRSTSVEAQDVKTLDVGNFFLITNDSLEEDAPWGKLWVEYDVTLTVPQIPAEGFAPYGGEVFNSNPTAPGNPLEDNAELTGASAGLVLDSTNGRLGFAARGQYVITSVAVGTVVTNIAYALGGGVVILEDLEIINGAGTQDLLRQVINVVEPYNAGTGTGFIAWSVVATTFTDFKAVVGMMPPGSFQSPPPPEQPVEWHVVPKRKDSLSALVSTKRKDKC